MNPFSQLWSAVMAGYKAFQSAYMRSDQDNLDKFVSFDARRLRYSILWAMYENTGYDVMHTWAETYKTKYGLYKYIRNIYNPAYRLGEFWKAHLLGGKLDMEAGDGSEVKSCLPIITENEALRPAISQVWKWSNWQIKKDVLGLWTPVLGDGMLKIVDDPERQKVKLEIVHPSRLKEVHMDSAGNVKGYVLEYKRADPRENRDGYVTYREKVTRNGEDVEYQTYLDNNLYAWGDVKDESGNALAEWAAPYGFVPFVMFQHNDVGLDFGWSEIYPGLSKFREVDDQASKLHDQIRKVVSAPMLMAGVTDPATNPAATTQGKGQTPTDKNPQPGRQEMNMIWTPNEKAHADPLVATLDIAAVTTNIQELLSELERDYPELRLGLENASQENSGTALRISRAPAENKVQQRRPNYDDALVRAQQMAVAIAGWRGYGEAFTGFGLDSYAAGQLDHSIGDRPVFDVDSFSKLEEDKVFWDSANAAKLAGVPLPVWLKWQGWNDEKISAITNSPEYQAKIMTVQAQAEAAKNMASGEVPSTNRFGNNGKPTGTSN